MKVFNLSNTDIDEKLLETDKKTVIILDVVIIFCNKVNKHPNFRLKEISHTT